MGHVPRPRDCRQKEEFAIIGVGGGRTSRSAGDARSVQQELLQGYNQSKGALSFHFGQNDSHLDCVFQIDESRLLALWAPMLSDLSDIDWDLLGSAFQKVDLSLLTPETTIVVPYRRVSKRLFHFVSTRTDVTTLSSTALIETDAGAARQKLARRYPNYFVYTKVAYDFHDLDEATQDAILELRSLPDHPANHLSLVALKAGNVPYAPVVKNLPLGMCRVSILSASFWGTIRKTPSLLRLIHDWVQVKLAIQKFDLPPIDIPLFIEALTPPIA